MSSTLCTVCQAKEGKYKCSKPNCTAKYCSIACSKKHAQEPHPDSNAGTPAASGAPESSAGSSANPTMIADSSYQKITKLLENEEFKNTLTQIAQDGMKPAKFGGREWDEEKALEGLRKVLREGKNAEQMQEFIATILKAKPAGEE